MTICVHRIVMSAAVATTLAGASLLAQAPAHSPQATFRSSVDLVSIQASVKDRRGRPVKGLTTADFEVRDNGLPRPILSMRSDQSSAVSLAILVDMSGSMRVGPKMAMARQAFDIIVSQLRQGEDEVALFTFDSALHERHTFTSNFGDLVGALDDLRPFGSTSLYDATAATARRLSERPASHKAIVILTDGIDTSSAMSAAEVSGFASSIDVPVYVVATVPAIDEVQILEAATHSTSSDGADLRDLADWTGGQLVFAHTAVDNVTLASSMLDELRQRYVLAIEAAGDHEWRRLEVRVRKSSAVVKARSGYFGG
ncbi:MAG: Ca-activated chloride channel [Acidobacteriota bacterium]|jgi:VWFA-related protein